MNFLKMMEQAQQMQSRVNSLQDELALVEVEGVSGGGMVKVVTTCQHKLNSLVIDPELIDPDETKMLEDLIVAALNDAHDKAEEKTREKTAEVTRDFQWLAGQKLPF